MRLFSVLPAILVLLATQPTSAANIYPEDGLDIFGTRLYCRGEQVQVYAMHTTTDLNDPETILGAHYFPAGMSCSELGRDEIYFSESYGFRMSSGNRSRSVIFQEYRDTSGETWYRWEYHD